MQRVAFEDQQAGLTLVEVLAAVVILSLVAIAFARFSVVSLQTVAFYNHQAQAFQLARREAIAFTDNDRSLSPQSPVTINGVTYSTSEPPSQDTSFSDPNDPGLKKYVVTVSWPNEAGVGTRSVSLAVYISS